MKSLFNLIILLVLIFGGIYGYAFYTEDEEMKAKITYYVNNIVYIAQEEYADWKEGAQDGVDDAKRGLGDIKRDAGGLLRN